MKKVILMLTMVLFSLGLVGCTNDFSVDQSEKKLEVYRAVLQKIADEHEVVLTGIWEDLIGYREYSISISDDEEIHIYMWCYPNTAGSFRMEYILDNENYDNEFDVELFVDLVNGISGRTLSYEFCMDFLDAPESEYSVERYGYGKDDDEIISKMEHLNFFEDWTLYYTLYDTQTEYLTFGGLPKQISVIFL